MDYNKEMVTVCIPTLNEGESIGEVVSSICEVGYDPIVIDGGSTDDTVHIAESNGATVIEQTIDGGKGAAVVQMLRDEDGILVFIDGDCTYEPRHIPSLVNGIVKYNYDQVIGNRFYNMDQDAMSDSHQFGNRVANLIFRVIFGDNLVDILSGLRAIDTSSFDPNDIESRGFDIETELCAYSIQNNHNIGIIGTNYYERKGDSKLGEIKDTLKIGKRMLSCKFNYILSE